MGLYLSITTAILVNIYAVIPAFAQDVNQAAYDAAVQTATQQQQQAAIQTQQYNEQMSHVASANAGDPSYCFSYGTCKNSAPAAKGFDLDALLFGNMQQPVAAVDPSEALSAAHHYHHRRKRVSQRVP